jgi:hypothetical protein
MAIQNYSAVILSFFSLCMLMPMHIVGGKKQSPKNSRTLQNNNQTLPTLFKDAEPTLYKSSETFWNDYKKKENELLLCISTFAPKEKFQDCLIKLTEFARNYKENPDLANNMIEGTKEKMKASAQVAHDITKKHHLDASQLLAFTKETLKSEILENETLPIWHQHRLEFKNAIALQRYINTTLLKEEYQEIPEEAETNE